MTDAIDIHHHAFPPAYVQECRAQILGPAVDFEHVLHWTPERSLEAMHAAGCERAILSVSAPGVWFGDDRQAVRLSRACNDYLAEVARAYPGRLGFFATLPLPDVEASVAEIERAFDELGADGVCMMTSYDRTWLGGREHAEMFAELQRRRAAVFVHPVIPPACRGLMPTVPDALAEFAFDTTRTLMSLLFGGTMAACPDVRFAFSHGGGATVMLLERLKHVPRLRPQFAEAVPDGVPATLARQFYDTASMSESACLAALRVMPGMDQLVLASDYPYRDMTQVIESLPGAGIDGDERARIAVHNPRRFLGLA